MKATDADRARVARAKRRDILKRKRERVLQTNRDNSTIMTSTSESLEVQPTQGRKRGIASIMEASTSKMAETSQNRGTKTNRNRRQRTDNNCLQRCPDCDALVWKSESTKKNTSSGKLSFTICCQQGRVELPKMRKPPAILQSLLTESPSFRTNIRAYNSILAFTSMGAKIDNTIPPRNGMYTFRIQGQNHHNIGMLLPKEGQPPRFAQLYIYDTANEVENRIKTLKRRQGSEELDKNIVSELIQMMDENNEIAKVFRKARDRYELGKTRDYTIRLIGQKNKGRQYDLPIAEELAGLIVGDLSTTTEGRDIIAQRHSKQFQRISDVKPLYMPMQYPLLFPYGEKGFEDKKIPYKDLEKKKIKREYVTMREYYAYQIQTRLSEGTHIIKACRLFHQYLVDAYIAIEQGHLRWIKNNQKTLRAEVYNNVRDAVTKGDTDARLVGRSYILPSSYTGSPRYMAENFHDAMAICRWKGNPQLFITITANLNWMEITEHIQQSGNNTANDRPDIECRVFKMKLQEMLADIQNGLLGGTPQAVVYTIEFQKRGLPHAHILIWLEEKFKNPTPAQIDSLISAEIPDKKTDLEGYALVEQFMMHGPCGLDRPESPCMQNGACKKKFPKSYRETTSINKDGYIRYKRRNDDRLFVMKGKTKMDNAFVVPHNIDLLKKYRAHINVEWCNKTRAIKYLFKYITKGVDRATMIIEKADENGNGEQERKKGVDEIKNYLECRYISACEATWRIFAYDIHYRTPAVRRLTIHLPNQQRVVYNESDDLGYIISQEGISKTMFTEWMERNKIDEEARKLTYAQFPENYVWDGKNKLWTKRAQGKTVGRIINIHPAAGELYYLKRLVDILKGPKSFTEILTVGTKVHPTFKSACYGRGLLDGDLEWHDAMDEAAKWATPTQLRHLFATLLLYCEVGSPNNLWKHFWKDMSDDIPRRLRKRFSFEDLEFTDEELQNYTLMEIEKILQQNEKSLIDYDDMPKPDQNLLKELTNSLLREETNYNIGEQQKEHDILSQSLNEEQKRVFEAVVDSVEQRKGKLFFLYRAGGTGKTYLYKTIITKLRAERKIVLPVASSGIAALLLPGGRTAHSRFKIPINVHEESLCEVKAGTMLAKLLVETDLIIWDEAPMAHRHTFEAVDKTLRDLLCIKDPAAKKKTFGGKTVLLGGDFRQILPVVPEGTRQETILATINRSALWDSCEVYTLTKNMRMDRAKRAFAEWVLKVGDGNAKRSSKTKSTDEEIEMIEIQKELLLERKEDPMKEIVKDTYSEMQRAKNDRNYLRERAILTPTNETVDEINVIILENAPGKTYEYFSSDSIEKDADDAFNHNILYPMEFLNSLKFPGLPNHKLELKENTPIMLLRNVNQKEGLCNGTRLVVTRLGKKAIEAEILTGTHIGNKIIIPRIILSPTDTKWPFKLRRRQFPIRVCYSMTINKSQGQTLKKMGLCLPRPIFSHGQLYVAISRVASPEGLKILRSKNTKEEDGEIENIIYREVFNNLPQQTPSK